MAEGKGAGQGKGKFTKAGIQAEQSNDIQNLKLAVAALASAGEELEARVDELEGGPVEEPVEETPEA